MDRQIKTNTRPLSQRQLEAEHWIECITHVSLSGVTERNEPAPHGCLVATLWPCDLDLWSWPLIFWPSIHCWARYRDRPSLCQVWRFWFKPFWFYRADRQTDRQNHRGGWSRLRSAWVMMRLMYSSVWCDVTVACSVVWGVVMYVCI